VSLRSSPGEGTTVTLTLKLWGDTESNGGGEAPSVRTS